MKWHVKGVGVGKKANDSYKYDMDNLFFARDSSFLVSSLFVNITLKSLFFKFTIYHI